ncbi:SMP-30/gluconolactonase/LRE family protein [Tundrisphaera lichenicola]|uniref:SMP-30/gluconolactonase/LRE family protein n=1 Tax=Tundrisphaera lichenicola TaxID=2029860 RepID=UPI003EB8B494
MIPILRDAGLSKLLDSDSVETVADGLVFTEGPLWLPDGSLLFQDIKAERTYKVAPDGSVRVLREQTHAANGQTFDPKGRVVFCEQNGRRISRMDPDGSNVETVVEAWEGKRLNSPNDIVARSDGLLYFTDPPYGVQPDDREIPFQGVYALDGLGIPRPVLDDFEKPNGLAFSPDDRTLYVCDTARYHVRAFDVEKSGTIDQASGRVFCTLDPGQAGGPDGMKVDLEGRVYVAVALGVWVFEPDGKLLGILGLPQRPSNLNWGGPGGKTLAITAVDHVYKVRFQAAGLTPPFVPRPI